MLVEFLIISLYLLCYGVFRIVYRWRKSRKGLYQLAKQLPGPPALPVIGNALIFNCSHDELYTRLTSVIGKYPNSMRFWLGPELIAAFTNPDQIEKIVTSSKMTYKHDVYRFIQVFGGNGLISGSGPRWKAHRKLIQPLYHQKYVNLNIELLQKNVDVLIKKLSPHVDGPTFDIHDDIHYCCIDFISEILFGERVNAQKGDNVKFIDATIQWYELVFDRMLKVWLQPEFIYKFTKYKSVEVELIKEQDRYLTKAIEMGRKRLKEDTVIDDKKPIPTMDLILELLEENPDAMNEQELKHHLLTLYLAGEDPMTITSSFTCYCLGMYPEYQQKAAEEIRKVFGDSPRDVTVEDLKQLTYLEWCIKDVLRICPIGPFILRKPIEEFTLDEYTIPKGCGVLIPITNIHRDPNQWEKPNDFFPDHFRPEAILKRHPYAYMPFSAGQRGCIGKLLAMTGLKTLMAIILQSYCIEADGKFPDVRLKSDISVRPIDGYRVRLLDRKWD